MDSLYQKFFSALLSVYKGTDTNIVDCPVCGIQGTLTVEDGKVKVDFPKAQTERARGTFKGLREHTTEIQNFGSICGPKIMANKEMLDRKMKERIKNFSETIAQ